MKRLLFVFTGLLFVVLVFGQTTPTKGDESPCNRHYEAAIKFLVDTPVLHPFTVDAASGNKVLFSSGNLQYCAVYSEIQSDGLKHTVHNAWRFSPRQFDFVGGGNLGGNVYYDTVIQEAVKSVVDPNRDSFRYERRLCNNEARSAAYPGWIDLLPWGSSCLGRKVHDPFARHMRPCDVPDYVSVVSASHNTYGIGPSLDLGTTTPDSTPAGVLNASFDTASGLNRYFDWGFGNGIREYRKCTQVRNDSILHYRDSTMYRTGVWRTPTVAEWKYLLETRTLPEDAGKAGWSCITLKDTLAVNAAYPTVTGILLYPDDFSFAEVGVALLTCGPGSITATPQIVSMSDWELLELAGCIFLPSAFYYDSQNASMSNKDGASQACTTMCSYWSCTNVETADAPAGKTANTLAYCATVTWDGTTGVAVGDGVFPRPDGYSVRLVQDFVPKGL